MLATPPAENSQTTLFTQTDQRSGHLPQLIEASKALLPFLVNKHLKLTRHWRLKLAHLIGHKANMISAHI